MYLYKNYFIKQVTKVQLVMGQSYRGICVLSIMVGKRKFNNFCDTFDHEDFTVEQRLLIQCAIIKV